MGPQDCRSQYYDNADVMTVHVSGNPGKITDKYHFIVFVNYDNQSLNLFVVYAANIMIVIFFGTI